MLLEPFCMQISSPTIALGDLAEQIPEDDTRMLKVAPLLLNLPSLEQNVLEILIENWNVFTKEELS